MKEDLRVTWGLIAFNAAFMVMNLGFFIGNAVNGRWTALFSLVAMIVNAWAAWFCYSTMKQREQQRKERVVDYLSGKIG